MVDLGTGAGFPARAGVPLEVIGGLVAHQLESITAFDECLPLGDEALQFDGFHFAAILFSLESALRLFVVVEFAFDPVGGAVKEIDGRPEEIGEVRFEAGVVQGSDQGVEDVGDGASDTVAFGKRPGIGFVSERTVAVELELLQNVVGGGRVVGRLKIVVPAHGMLHRLDRDRRGLHGEEAHRRNGPEPGAWRRAGATAEDGRGRLFWFAMERRDAPPENSLPPPLPDQTACGPIALSKAEARSSFDGETHPDGHSDGVAHRNP